MLVTLSVRSFDESSLMTNTATPCVMELNCRKGQSSSQVSAHFSSSRNSEILPSKLWKSPSNCKSGCSPTLKGRHGAQGVQRSSFNLARPDAPRPSSGGAGRTCKVHDSHFLITIPVHGSEGGKWLVQAGFKSALTYRGDIGIPGYTGFNPSATCIPLSVKAETAYVGKQNCQPGMVPGVMYHNAYRLLCTCAGLEAGENQKGTLESEDPHMKSL